MPSPRIAGSSELLTPSRRVDQNNASLRQLTFVGKKSVPASLRKDIWQPMATISFPYGPQGLHAFRKLREYRKMHELAIPIEDIRDKTKTDPNALMERKKRPRLLMDQKANSVADIAAVLAKQAEAGTAWARTTDSTTPGDPSQSRPAAPSTVSDGEEGSSGVTGVTISWRNIFDAEFAESWPSEVVHSGLDYTRHTIDNPAREEEETQ